MMRYATVYDGKTMARAMGVGLPISTKKTVEIASFVRGRPLAKVVALLEGVADEKVAIPFRKYAKGGTGHKPGIGPGRYPKKACVEVIKLLKHAEANAKGKGLDVTKLVVSAIVAKKGAQSWHFGRQRRIRMKVTHLEVVVSEMAKEVPSKKASKAKAAPSQAAKEEKKAVGNAGAGNVESGKK